MNPNMAYNYDDDYRSELINGKIIMMLPRPVFNHVTVASNIYRIFANYLKGKSCTPFDDGFDLYLTEKDHFVPDAMVVCDPNKIKYNGVHGAPDLVVEVLSPSTAKRDKTYKKQVYEQCGVQEYWIVDVDSKRLEQYLLQEGQLQLVEVYSVYPDYIWNKMTAEEQAAVPLELKCSLYDDLLIKLEDVFERVK